MGEVNPRYGWYEARKDGYQIRINLINYQQSIITNETIIISLIEAIIEADIENIIGKKCIWGKQIFG